MEKGELIIGAFLIAFGLIVSALMSSIDSEFGSTVVAVTGIVFLFAMISGIDTGADGGDER